ncbi:hypothetical protein SESBI_48701 [Sesbania bispinosa]|nr:hypothetical protein SESBI_48701 [Sesbania bispinosa]
MSGIEIVKMPKKNDSFVPQMDAKELKSFSKTGKRKQGAQTSEPIPNRMSGIEIGKLSELEHLDASLLQSFVPMSCTVLIEKEGDAEALRPYIVKMSKKNNSFIPQMDTKALKAFSKTRKRKQGTQTTEPIPSLCDEGVTRWLQQEMGWKLRVVDFLRRQSVESREYCQNGADLHHTDCLLGSHFGVGDRVVRKEFKDKAQQLKDQDEELSRGKEESDALLEKQAKSLKVAEENLTAKKIGWKTDEDNLKAEIVFQYEQGFDKAIDQVKFLYPSLNVEEVEAFKEIQGGEVSRHS